jgi:3-oxo-5alpha-steroid 4-dehydrogenase
MTSSSTHPDGSLPIEAPIAVDPRSQAFDESCDVLVVGFGAAGAAAAIVARESGADVRIVERFEGGGASARSGGIVYAGGGTSHQKKAGYDDTPDAMFRYLKMETRDAVSEITLRRFCEDSTRLIEWLESIGANFESSAPPPKTSYPKDGVYLYYSGNESVPEYAAVAKPAPRGHRTRGSWLSGKALFEFLKARVAALNIPVTTQSAVRRLVTDAASGAVIGAEVWRLAPGSAEAAKYIKLMRRAESVHNIRPSWADKIRAKAVAIENAHAKPVLVRATRGVILTAGGFIFNRAMVERHAPKYRRTLRLGATGCDGSGIRLGESVGGATGRMDRVSAWRFINPPTAWPSGIVVNARGSRFCNEQVYGAKLGVAMCEDHDGRAWLILDRKLRKAAMKEAAFGGLWWFQSVPSLMLMLSSPKAADAAALAARMGFDAQTLRTTIDDYNRASHGEAADTVGKDKAYLAGLDDGPYWALDISAGNRNFPCPAITLGGLRVDETNGAVLNTKGLPIAGLYAAGRTAVGIASNNYVSGLSLADCLWGGRRAGAAAAAPAQEQRRIA